MTFEVINDKNNVVMYTHHLSLIPNDNMLELMSEANLKFRLDGKITPLKKLKKQLKELNELNNEQNN